MSFYNVKFTNLIGEIASLKALMSKQAATWNELIGNKAAAKQKNES